MPLGHYRCRGGLCRGGSFGGGSFGGESYGDRAYGTYDRERYGGIGYGGEDYGPYDGKRYGGGGYGGRPGGERFHAPLVDRTPLHPEEHSRGGSRAMGDPNAAGQRSFEGGLGGGQTDGGMRGSPMHGVYGCKTCGSEFLTLLD